MRKILPLALVALFCRDNFMQNNGRIHLYAGIWGNIEHHMTRVLKVRVPPELEESFDTAVSYWRGQTGYELFVSVEENEDLTIEIADIGRFGGLAHMNGMLNLNDRVYNITGGWIRISSNNIRNRVCEEFVMIHELGHMLGLEDDFRTRRIMDGRGICVVTDLLDSDRELILEDIRNAGIH